MFAQDDGISADFIIQVVQGLVIALGAAFFLGNLVALVHSRGAAGRYEDDMAQWRKDKKKARKTGERLPPKPEEPQQVQAGAAIVQMLIGLAIALLGIAALTFNWVT